MRHEGLLYIHVLIMMARGAGFYYLLYVVIYVDPEHRTLGTELAFFCSLVCIV